MKRILSIVLVMAIVFSLFPQASFLQKVYAEDDAPPVISDGTITIGKISDQSVLLSWTAASDTVTDAAELQYMIVRSPANNIDTVASIMENGILVQNWTANMTSKEITGLTPNSTYYYNIIVKDKAGNKSAYTAKQQNTLRGAVARFGGEHGTELFLGGNYIELGISNWGDFGTLGDKPSGFRGTAGGEHAYGGSNKIGMSADHDGFNNGHDMPIDYYLPGTPEERFAVGYKVGTSTYSNSNSAQMDSKNMDTTVTDESEPENGLLKATIVSTWTDKMEITQVISFGVNDKFYRNDVTIRNLSGTAWDSARYMRSFDPDNTVYRSGRFETANTVTHTIAEDGKAVVKAETFDDGDEIYKAFGSRAPIFFYSSDPAAVASIFGFSNSDPYYDPDKVTDPEELDPYGYDAYDNPATKNEKITDDIAITMTWDAGTLPPNESKKFAYYTSLDERDFDEVQGDIITADIEKDIEDAENMDDVKQVKDKIDDEDNLDDGQKEELKGTLVDILCDYPPVKRIPLRDDADILIVRKLINESDKTPDDKDDARKRLVEKAVEDIDPLTDEDKEVLKDVIDDIGDSVKKREAANILPGLYVTAPEVLTVAPEENDIGSIWAIVHGNVASDGGEARMDRGFEYGKLAGGSETVYKAVYEEVYGAEAIGDFSFTLTELEPDTEYTVRAFARNSIGTSYGDDVTFTTVRRSLLAVPDEELNEDNLDGSVITLTLSGDSFREAIDASDITFSNAPEGLTVTEAVYGDAQNCSIVLGFDGPPIGKSINKFNITVAGSALTGRKDITSNNMTIQSSDLWSDVEALDIVYADYDNVDEASDDNATHVTRALYLPVKGKSGKTTIIWTSDKPDVITNTGRVTRPEAEGDDADVTLTATIKEDAAGGIETTRSFKVKVLKLGELDAAKDAAKQLTIDKAFGFGEGDTWECITKQFFAFTSGEHGTQIDWSSNSSAIRIEASEVPGQVNATVTRPSDNNKNVILTATIKKGTAEVTKTFLLVVQKAGVDKPADETRQPTGRTAEAATGGSGQPAQNIAIERTVLEDHTKIDYVMVDANIIQSLTEAMNPQSSDEGRRTVTIVMHQDASDKADQLAVEIPAAAVGAMADRNAIFRINTDEGSVEIQSSVLSDMAQAGTDLYFRIVPVNDATEQNAARISAQGDSHIVQLVGGGKQLSVLGIPRRIETNYTGFRTSVILPLTGITIPTTGRTEFLSSLRVFVEHSDSTELKTPEIVYDGNGVPAGVKFDIEEFSRFQIVRAVAAAGGRDNGNDRDNDRDSDDTPAVAPTQQSAVTGGTDITVGDKKMADILEIIKTQAGGKTNLQIIIKDDKLSDMIKNGGTGEIIRIATGEPADKHEIALNAALLKELQAKQDILSIATPGATWNIPTAAVNIDELYDKMGKPSEWKDVVVKLTLNKVGNDKQSSIMAAIKAMGAQLLGEPVERSITLSYSGKEVAAGLMNQYTQMLIPLGKGMDRQKITTGVYVSNDMKISHVPTEVTIIDGSYYAKINSLYGDGVHTVIWNPKEFPDVAKHWSKTDTNDAYSRTIVFGANNGLYMPDKEITRAEFAAILTRSLGLRPVEDKKTFSDVAKGAWYSEVIQTASHFDLIKGYGDGTFKPDKAISREEAMAITARAMKLTGLKSGLNGEKLEELLGAFEDGKDTAVWAKDAAAACIDTGVISGRSGKRIEPKDNVTRAEVAAIVERLLKKSKLI